MHTFLHAVRMQVYLFIFYCPFVISLICNAEIYGTPNSQDCINAINEIPFALEPYSNPYSQIPRLFAEPQYLEPPFDAVRNVFRPNAIIQLPKIWKHSM